MRWWIHGATLCLLASAATTQETVRNVLGIGIEHVDESHRVVDVDGDVLCHGSLSECEHHLVAVLLNRHGSGTLNLVAKTSGGKQVWGDSYLFAGWRVQENVLTGHHRLLDPQDNRRAWGTFEACRTVFEKTRVEQGLNVANPHLVVIVHGLGRSRSSMGAMTTAFAERGYEIASFGYPSTRASIEDHAARLAGVLDAYDGIRDVSFVTYSMGGLVVRAALARNDSWRDRLTARGLVMVAPPNHGSALAAELDGAAAQMVMGAVIDDLKAERVTAMPVPAIPFAVIAGGNGGEGHTDRLPGDDDGMVRVESAKLPGMTAFLRIDAKHRALKRHPDVIRAAVSFVETGHLPGQAR